MLEYGGYSQKGGSTDPHTFCIKIKDNMHLSWNTDYKLLLLVYWEIYYYV